MSIEKLKWAFVGALLPYGLVLIAMGGVNPAIENCRGGKFSSPICIAR